MKLLYTALLALVLTGCQTSSQMKVGSYSFIHFNDPMCMGSSASGAIMLKDESVVRSQISQKTGYCESITGQVITSTGEAVKGYVGARRNRNAQQSVNVEGSSPATETPIPGASIK